MAESKKQKIVINDDLLRKYLAGQLSPSVNQRLAKFIENEPKLQARLQALESDNWPVSQSDTSPAETLPAQTTSSEDGFSLPSQLNRQAESNSSPLSVPQELAEFPQYEVLRELGRGGMGVVFLARNVPLDRLEVLKVLSPGLYENETAQKRFQTEIRSVAKLSHPSIVVPYGILPLPQLIVLAMEYVEGGSLHDMISRSKMLSVQQACAIAARVAGGLQHAYSRDLIHRDIKPSNIMVATEDDGELRVKILDFGLAKASTPTTSTALTKEGTFLGTPEYMAPEQILNAASATICSDIYSLGCTLYEMLVGQPPFVGTPGEIMFAQVQQQAPPLNLIRNDIPHELSLVIAKMMAKEPQQRFQTPQEVQVALQPFVDPLSIGANGPVMGTMPVAEVVSPANVPTAVPLITKPVPPAIVTRHGPAERSKKSRVGVWGALLGTLIVGLAVAGFWLQQPTEGTLVFEQLPGHAEVKIDGQVVLPELTADANQAVLLAAAGSHQVQIAYDNQVVFDQTLDIEKGKRVTIAVPLPAPDAEAPQAEDAAQLSANVPASPTGNGVPDNVAQAAGTLLLNQAETDELIKKVEAYLKTRQLAASQLDFRFRLAIKDMANSQQRQTLLQQEWDLFQETGYAPTSLVMQDAAKAYLGSLTQARDELLRWYDARAMKFQGRPDLVGYIEQTRKQAAQACVAIRLDNQVAEDQHVARHWNLLPDGKTNRGQAEWAFTPQGIRISNGSTNDECICDSGSNELLCRQISPEHGEIHYRSQVSLEATAATVPDAVLGEMIAGLLVDKDLTAAKSLVQFVASENPRAAIVPFLQMVERYPLLRQRKSVSQFSESSVSLADCLTIQESVGKLSPLRDRFEESAGRYQPFIRPGGEFHERGISAIPPSVYQFSLDGSWDNFDATIGLQPGGPQRSVATFIVQGDGKELFRSRPIEAGDIEQIEVDIRGVRVLNLRTETPSNSTGESWSVWGTPMISRAKTTPPPPQKIAQQSKPETSSFRPGSEWRGTRNALYSMQIVERNGNAFRARIFPKKGAAREIIGQIEEDIIYWPHDSANAIKETIGILGEDQIELFENPSYNIFNDRSQTPFRSSLTLKPSDVLSFQDREYFIYDKQVNWSTAKGLCESMGGMLAIVATPEQNEFLTKAGRQKNNSHLWLGGTDSLVEGNWMWLGGSPMTFTAWENENLESLAKRDFLALDSQTGSWIALPDNPQSANEIPPFPSPGFVCQWDKLQTDVPSGETITPASQADPLPGKIDLISGIERSFLKKVFADLMNAAEYAPAKLIAKQLDNIFAGQPVHSFFEAVQAYDPDRKLTDLETFSGQQVALSDVQSIEANGSWRLNRVRDKSFFLRLSYSRRYRSNPDETVPDKGISMTGGAKCVYPTNRRWKRFKATIGIRDSYKRDEYIFVVKGDGRTIFTSGLTDKTNTQFIDLDISGISNLELMVESKEKYSYYEALWLDPRIER